MNILCTICAREGSRGLKNKNIILLKNKPLISHTIIQAQKSKLFTEIVVSSDSKKIQSVSIKNGINIFLLVVKIYHLIKLEKYL